MRLSFRPSIIASAHCDLPCGVYDPKAARFEAESVLSIQKKFQDSDDPIFRTRAIMIKEQRAQMVKEILWTLWTDYFTPAMVEVHPQVTDLIWRATKLAGSGGVKGTMNPASGEELIKLIDQIDEIFLETKKPKG